jgi:glycosidase
MSKYKLFVWLTVVSLILGALPMSVMATPQAISSVASHTPAPTSVNLAGDLESEATGGACGDWDPACPASDFAPQGNEVFLFNSAPIPAGDWQYKVAINRSWDENYGANFQQNGPNIALSLAAARTVRFYYDHKTHYIADNVRNTIYTVPGSFNSEIGCGDDWQPECLRTFMSDVDGDGIFTFATEGIPQGSYEFKIATNESWSNPNYGQGGGPNNVPFTVPGPGFRVTFTFNTADNNPGVTVVSTGPKPDNNVEWDGLRYDSRDTLYRTPGGAVPAGTPVTIRFRTFHNDVTAVTLRVYDINVSAQSLIKMTPAATDVSCYQPGLEQFTCDFWAATLPNAVPDNLWYRFIVTDGTKTVYYADNTAALDGGLGSPSDTPIDNSFALMVYTPTFTAPSWASNAVIYQIFPDRFRNGRANNDPRTGDIRYDDPVIKLSWGTLPEGYCRNYAGATSATCPWRFDTNPPASSPLEQPRGRDYMGGDLKGVDQQLDYLWSMGVNTIYFNPIFDSGSNHGYDTQNYYQIDPYFGTQKDWENLVKHANQLGIRIVLDGVFNHMSSDSPFFDRYHHYPTVGACEDVNSPYRAWFTFHDVAAGTGTCAGSAGPNSATYDGWFGFDSIPVINKSLSDVQQYFLTGSNSVSKYWLKQGAGGWRMDVMGDASFPAGYWKTFRDVVKTTKSDALIISETWQKDSTLLRMLRGDRADTTMNYRLRDAVIGLLAPGSFDSKGFADSGRVIKPSEFAARIESIREDYPDAAYYSLMNLLDSHDTERLLWTLTPGADNRTDKELNAANLAAGKQRMRMASLIQFTLPGAPTVFYGDEVGVTGDDDPDDRRTFPWPDLGGQIDQQLQQHYRVLAALRRVSPALTKGDLKVLLADDTSEVIAYGRKTDYQGAVVIINRSSETRSGAIPVAGYLPDGTVLYTLYGVGSGGPGKVTVTNGQLVGTIGPNSAWVLMTGLVDLKPTAAPTGLTVTNEGNQQISLSWNSVAGATSYNIYRSPVSGGGWIKVNTAPINATSFTDTNLQNARTYFYVVRAVDNAGNESAASNEVSALPHLVIGWANLQWPPTLNHTISAINRTDNVYGQVWIDGATNQPGATPSLRAQLGFGPAGSNPANNSAWTWVDASFNVDAGNNDEFMASLLPEATGSFDYVYRYTTTNGRDWLYADLNGPIASGVTPPNPGKLTVNPSGDTTPPAAPANLRVSSASPVGINLEWDAVVGDATLYGYEVLRSDASGGPYTKLGFVTGTSYVDTSVVENTTYFYVVRSVDMSFNRSGNSNEVTATAVLRTVSVVFNVTVPATTDATGRSVYIAGFLDRLDGNLPQWDPGGVALTRVDATHWTITLTGKETTQIEYKYALGSWDYVEKDASCGEISNRQLTLSYGANGTQIVNDIVPNWRNVSPCGN